MRLSQLFVTATFALLGGMIAQLLVSPTPIAAEGDKVREIRATRFVLVDKDGKELGEWGGKLDGRISCKGVFVAVSPMKLGGPVVAISPGGLALLPDLDGREEWTKAVQNSTRLSPTGLMISDPRSTTGTITLLATEKHGPLITLYDRSGKKSIHLAANEPDRETGEIGLYDTNGKMRAGLYYNAKGKPVIATWDDDGDAVAAIGGK